MASVSEIIANTVARAWGGIPRVPWVRVSAALDDRPDALMSVTVEVTVDPHDVTCRLFPKRTFVRQEGGRVTARSNIQPSELPKDADASQVVAAHTTNAIRFASGLLREADPRLGTIVTKADEMPTFPRGILFDPPRMRPPAWEVAGIDAMTCPICNSRFGRGFPAMWSGGNLLWTHPSCWLRARDGL